MEQEATRRRLAAILAADVVGYSKLMGADEMGTLTALKRHREELFEPAVARHTGRTFKLIGDGTLVEFASVVDAVGCALDIQRSIASETTASAGPRIRLRIGINLGDVILDGDDVYGDGVNVAARLEPLAEHGGICVSSIVRESVGGRLDIDFADGGEVEVKNIVRPLRIWKWSPDATTAPVASELVEASKPALPTTEAPVVSPAISIAVLPFDNMSGDPEQEYFSDGISEDIITDLSKVGGLTVIARNSSFVYKGKSVDLRAVGRELGVTNVLEGSIRRAGNRVRINAQLIDANDGSHLWAERFDRDLTDIFEVQDEVTQHIVNALKVTLSPAEAELVTNIPSHNSEAHDCYLRARELMTGMLHGREQFEEALRLMLKAVDLDPDYAEAQAALAMIYNYDHLNRWSDTHEQSHQKSRELARRAVELDPNEPFAHYALSVTSGIAGDMETFKREAERVLELSPNFGAAHNSLGIVKMHEGKYAAAIQDIEKAIRLDPVNNIFVHFLGMVHLFAGNFETTIATLRHRIVLYPQTDISRALLASALGHVGDAEEARRVWAELEAINPDYSLDVHLGTVFFRNPAHADQMTQGLMKAGIIDADGSENVS